MYKRSKVNSSENSGSSASLGVSFGTDGFLVTAGLSGSLGDTKGNGSTWTETVVQGGNNAGNTVTLQSGTDTNIIGSQVIGNRIIANVGTSGTGNLNIQSLQDTNQYKDKQQSVGGSVSIGYGRMGGSFNYSDSSIKSNYASVNEQAGLFAGDEGFQANVAGNTNLTGAVIASTEAAIQQNLNSLTTQTLTTSNIENSAEYEAKGMSIGAGIGTNEQPDGSYKNNPTASAGSSNLSDDSSSVTVSAISAGTVNITNNTAQTANTGEDAVTTLANLNRDVQTNLQTTEDGRQIAAAVDSAGNNLANTITPIFDQAQIQRELNAQLQITQAFSQVAPRAVGDYAGNKVKELTAQGNTEEAAKWDEGGIYRIALHTALGGLLTGDISGAAGAGAIAGAAPLLNDLQTKVTEALQSAGANSQTASAISQAIAQLTSIGIGSAIGGTAGAGTALVVDTNNRQLHEAQIQIIKRLAANDPDKERRLFIAGCVIERCSAGFPVDSAEYIFYNALELEGSKPEYQSEINQLRQQVAANTFNTPSFDRDYTDIVIDAAAASVRENPRTVAGGAALIGAVGTVLGAGATIVDTPVCIATGVGCVLTALTASGTVISADYTYAEGHYAITGVRETTIGESLLIQAGLSPEAASQVYAVAGIATAGASIIANVGSRVLARANWGTGPLKPPAINPTASQSILIDGSQGLQSTNFSRFENVVQTATNNDQTRYLWTIDGRGVNIAPELNSVGSSTTIKHTNISSQASIGGEVWFGPNNTITLNAYSGRFGVGNPAVTEAEWLASVKKWESLGYRVIVQPFVKR